MKNAFSVLQPFGTLELKADCPQAQEKGEKG